MMSATSFSTGMLVRDAELFLVSHLSGAEFGEGRDYIANLLDC